MEIKTFHPVFLKFSSFGKKVVLGQIVMDKLSLCSPQRQFNSILYNMELLDQIRCSWIDKIPNPSQIKVLNLNIQIVCVRRKLISLLYPFEHLFGFIIFRKIRKGLYYISRTKRVQLKVLNGGGLIEIDQSQSLTHVQFTYVPPEYWFYPCHIKHILPSCLKP